MCLPFYRARTRYALKGLLVQEQFIKTTNLYAWKKIKRTVMCLPFYRARTQYALKGLLVQEQFIKTRNLF